MDIEIKILDKKFYGDEAQYYQSGLFGLMDNGVPNRLPSYATVGSAAMDLRITKDLLLLPNCSVLVPTGLAIHIKDPNIMGVIVPRSGLGHNDGLVLGNLVGVLDSDYIGEIKISLWNRSEEVIKYYAGDRVVQLAFVPVVKAVFNIVSDFSNNTQRGIGGFGNTGV